MQRRHRPPPLRPPLPLLRLRLPRQPLPPQPPPSKRRPQPIIHGYGHPDDANTDPDADADTNTDTDTCAYTYSNANATNADAHTHTDANTNAYFLLASLALPPVTTDANVPISIDEACVQILDGPCTNMWTYGGTYPGLMIRRPTGQTTNVTFTNNLNPAAGTI